jgi:hypothetical protein
MSDVFTDALNAPAGRLAEVVLGKITKGGGSELADHIRTRLDQLVDAPGKAGLLARVRLARDVPFLFDHAPDWTTSRIIPLFDWSSPDAASVWSARKYSSYVGSPKLFGLTKHSFLKIFGRSDTPTEDLRTFAEWLTTLLIVNYASGAGYPLLDTEARSALRRAGESAMSSVGHRLAVEMSSATPEQKIERWQTVVGPVFRAIWLATDNAFPEAADFIIPFIRPDDPRAQTTVFSIAEASDALFQAAPSKMLDLIAAVVGEAPPGSVYALGKALARVRAIDPALANTRKFQKLLTFASQHE